MREQRKRRRDVVRHHVDALARGVRPDDRQHLLHQLLFRIAMVLFFAGVLAIVAIFVVAATGHTPGLALYLLALLCPIGFLFGIGSALRAGRRVRGEERP